MNQILINTLLLAAYFAVLLAIGWTLSAVLRSQALSSTTSKMTWLY